MVSWARLSRISAKLLLELKWQKVKWVFYGYILTYLTFLSCLTLVGITVNYFIHEFDDQHPLIYPTCGISPGNKSVLASGDNCRLSKVFKYYVDQRNHSNYTCRGQNLEFLDPACIAYYSYFVFSRLCSVVGLVMALLIFFIEETVFQSRVPDHKRGPWWKLRGLKEVNMTRLTLLLCVTFMVNIWIGSSYRFIHIHIGCWALFFACVKLGFILQRLR